MTEIIFSDVVRCSSEDPLNPASNLLHSMKNEKWLCAKNSSVSCIEVEFIMNRQNIISYIDVGNHGCHSIEVLVSHSMRTKDQFYSLVPTFVLMSIAESKQNINTNKVQMFNKDHMVSHIRQQSWDRMKVVCQQPYSKPNQLHFGLSFFTAKTSDVNNFISKNLLKSEEDKPHQSKLKRIFSAISSPKKLLTKVAAVSAQPNPKIKKTSTSERNDLSSASRFRTNFVSPIVKSPKTKIFTPAAKAQFYDEMMCFLADENFDELLKNDQPVKVSDLRVKIEKQRGLALSCFQKKLFMEIITDKLNEIQKKAKSNDMSTDASSFTTSSLSPLSAHDAPSPLSAHDAPSSLSAHDAPSPDASNALNAECENCHIRLPVGILAIHKDVCRSSSSPTTASAAPSLKSRSRNTLCFEVSSDEEEVVTSEKNGHTSSPWLTTQREPNSTFLNEQYNNLTNNTAPKIQQTSLSVGKNCTDYSVQPANGAMKETKRIDTGSSNNEQIDMQECPICGESISIYKIVTHASICDGVRPNELKSVIQPVEYIECPMCSRLVDRCIIEIHVNNCLDVAPV